MRARALLLLLLGLWPGAAAAEPLLVPAVSQSRVSIQGDFTGAQLLLFGAVKDPRVEAIDVVVVVRGPERAAIVREKQRIAGVWLNAASSEFRSVPGFYAAASSRPIDEIVDRDTADIYELGLEHLQLSPNDAIEPDKLARFEGGLVALKQGEGLYRYLPGAVRISEGVLYQAVIDLPANVPVGRYTAETFLLVNGNVEAVATTPIDVEKAGFGRLVTTLATRWGLLYGLVAVAMSVGIGWGAGALFRRV